MTVWMGVNERGTSVAFMFCAQQVFNCGEEQLLNITGACPAITIKSQPKASDGPVCACVHHENTRGWRILAD